MTSPSAPSAPRIEHRTGFGPCWRLSTNRPRLSWTVAAGAATTTCRPHTRSRSIAPAVVRRRSWWSPIDQVLGAMAGRSASMSRESVTVRVRVARRRSGATWSEPATVEAGLLEPQDWTRAVHQPRRPRGAAPAGARAARRSSSVPDDVVSARLYATAHGVYSRARCNGRPSTTPSSPPDGRRIEHRLRYQRLRRHRTWSTPASNTLT